MDVGCGEESGIYFWSRGEVGRARTLLVDTAVHEVDTEGSVVSRCRGGRLTCRLSTKSTERTRTWCARRCSTMRPRPGPGPPRQPWNRGRARPARGCIEQPVIEVRVEEGGEWREQDMEQEGHQGEGHQEQQAERSRPVL